MEIPSKFPTWYALAKAPSYRWNRAHILVDIDRKGKVKQTRDLLVFEKDMLRAVKKIRSYTPVKIENTEITVPFRQVLQFEKKNDTIYSHYSKQKE